MTSAPSNIISLSDKLLDRGEAEFCLCPYCDEQSSFLPIIRRNKKGDFISALLCVGPYCEGKSIFVPVLNGYVEEPEDFSEEA